MSCSPGSTERVGALSLAAADLVGSGCAPLRRFPAGANTGAIVVDAACAPDTDVAGIAGAVAGWPIGEVTRAGSAGAGAAGAGGAELRAGGAIAGGVEGGGGVAGGCRVMLGSVALRCPPSVAIANVPPPATTTAIAPTIASFHFGGVDGADTTPLDAPIVVAMGETGAIGPRAGLANGATGGPRIPGAAGALAGTAACDAAALAGIGSTSAAAGALGAPAATGALASGMFCAGPEATAAGAAMAPARSLTVAG